MPDVDLLLVVAGLAVGFVVGLTGMGGGALMTPLLVLFFGVAPLTAVSSDLLVSLVMKPVGGAVHARRGTVSRPLVLWLCAGSVPAAFTGVLVLRALGGEDGSEGLDRLLRTAMGLALLLAVAAMVGKAWMQVRRRAAALAAGRTTTDVDPAEVHVRPVPTVLVGAVGGFVVGMTSVGSGSLIIVALLLLHPRLNPATLVGTDLVQAVPLVGAATLGHLLFGDVSFGLSATLLLGALPGVWLGARAATSAPQRLVRRALCVVLLASGLKLLDVPTEAVGVVLLVVAVLGPFAWMALRRAGGLPADWRTERRQVHEARAREAAERQDTRVGQAGGGPADGAVP